MRLFVKLRPDVPNWSNFGSKFEGNMATHSIQTMCGVCYNKNPGGPDSAE